jgi:hypothetical protein
VTAVAGFARFADLAGVFLRGAGSTGAGVGTVLDEMDFAASSFCGNAGAFTGLREVTRDTSVVGFAGFTELSAAFKMLEVSDLCGFVFRAADSFFVADGLGFETEVEGADFVRTRRRAGLADLEAVDFFFIENRCGAGVAMDRLRRKLYVQRDGCATGISKGPVNNREQFESQAGDKRSWRS